MKILSPKMRDIKQLLSSAAGCDRISDYNFRSTEEVVAYLDGLGKQVAQIGTKLVAAAKFHVKATAVPRVAPIQTIDKKRLEESYQLLTELQHKLEILQSIEVVIAHNFRNQRETLTKQVRALRIKIEQQRDKALGSMERLAAEHEPIEFKQMVARAVVSLQKRLKRKFKTLKQYAYIVTGKEQDSVLVNHYVELRGLVNDHQDYVYPEYWIVFSAKINSQGALRTYATTLHEFRAPGSFSIGQEFVGQRGCEQAIDGMLLADEFIDAADRPSIGVRTSDVRIRKLQSKHVESVEVVDNKLRIVTMPIQKAALDQVVQDMIKDVTGILLPHGVKGALKYKLSARRNQQYNIDFVVVPTPAIVLDAAQERLLRERLGMSDAQIKQVRKLMDKGYV